MITKKEGKINVSIQRAEFTEAITMIAESNLWLAKALIQGQPRINITDAIITGSEVGINISSFDNSMEEESIFTSSPTSPRASETQSPEGV